MTQKTDIHADDDGVDRDDRPTSGDQVSTPYEVGYGRPPKSTRFQPGQSGNPKGGKKRRPTVAEQVEQVLRRKLTVTEGGQARRRSLQEIMLMSIGAKAAKGDLKAAAFLLEVRDSYRDSDAVDIDPTRLTEDNLDIVQDFLRQHQIGEPISAPAETEVSPSPLSGLDDDGGDDDL